MIQPLAEALHKTPLFGNLSPEELKRVSAIASPRHYARRETVFQEGDRADGFYVVISGRVKVFKLSADGKEQILHLIGPGQSFAEATIFEGGVFPAHAESLADSDLVFLPKRPFTEFLEKNPKVAIRMLASLSRWLKRMIDLVDSIALRDVETRLVGFIQEDLSGQGIPPRDGLVYELSVSKNVLAARLGTVPETFSRTLKKLQEEGKIRVRGRQIRILKSDALFEPLTR
ncbi:MAG: Crp/Fnr family transcriptional regulator [Deltaproteobacteria bacterium]|nr:Crp/Fnr family transcriptional regulator [Deltaproteobacteria bacterium]